VKIETHMNEKTFQSLPFAFPESNLQSWKVTKARAAWLARFQPVPYDCCINSCCCFVGPHADENTCPYCKEPRFRSDSKHPHKRFIYIPLIPRLVSFFRSPYMVEKLRYRAGFTESDVNITDIFDGNLYSHLCVQNVSIGENDLPHKFFQFPRDIALGLSTDGFAPWRRRTKTC
ncbi:hypothetical protein K435DRAFT_580313, partial [Dendrothele bispora CBS 962.96]